MYKNRLSEGFEDLKADLGRDISDQIYTDAGSKQTNPELTMKDFFKGLWEAFKISAAASGVVWEEAKDEIRKKYTDATMKFLGISPAFVEMLRKYGERKDSNPMK